MMTFLKLEHGGRRTTVEVDDCNLPATPKGTWITQQKGLIRENTLHTRPWERKGTWFLKSVTPWLLTVLPATVQSVH